MKKLLQLTLLILVLLTGAVATTQAQNTFDGYSRNYSDYSQAPYHGSQVQVFNLDCSPATNISQYSAPWTVYLNTVQTDANGYFIFIGGGGATTYILRFFGGTIQTPFQFRWVSNKTGIYNVKDFGDSLTGSGLADDTRAIGSAIAYIGAHNGGKLLVPGGYYKVGNPLGQCGDVAPIYDGFTLPSGITIEGTNGAPFSNCLLELVGANKKLFKILKNTNRIAIRDIKMRATSTTGTVAIFATGPTGSIGSPTSDLGFVFSSIYVESFEKGIHVLGSDSTRGWQFDNVKLQDSFLNGNKVGVLIDTINTDWHIDNCVIGVLPGGVSLQVENMGALTIHNMYGGGGSIAAGPGVTYPNPATAAKAFIWIKGQHGPINIQDSECENSFHSFLYDWNNPLFNWAGNTELPASRPPVTLHNNFMGDPVSLRANVVLVSTGNFFFSDTVRTVRNGGTDSDGSTYPGSYNSQIYSFGDQFAYRNSKNQDCPPITLGFDPAPDPDVSCRRDFGIDNTNAGMNTVVMRSGLAPVESPSPSERQKSRNTSSFQSAVRITSPPTDNAGTIWGYNIQRNYTTGYLDFIGNQKPPTFPQGSYVGFTFNGHMYPTEDAAYELGNGSKRWSLVRGVTVVSGDTILSDKTTGKELYRIREDDHFIYFEDIRTGKGMMRLDRDGNLFVVGRVYQRSHRAGKNQQNVSGSKASKANRNRKR